MPQPATVQELHITQAKGLPMEAVDVVQAVTDRGLEGDRYYLGTGYYSDKQQWGANVTLIQSEALEAINTGYQTDFTGQMLRRNIVTANIKLEALIGHDFKCGSTILHGIKQYPPCAHLAYLLGDPLVLKYFAYCGGVGARVVSSGEIQVGDTIEILDPAP